MGNRAYLVVIAAIGLSIVLAVQLFANYGSSFSRRMVVAELSKIESDSDYASPLFDEETCLARNYWSLKLCLATCFGEGHRRVDLDDESSDGNWYAARLSAAKDEVIVVSIPQPKFVWDLADDSATQKSCGRVQSIKVVKVFGLPKLAPEFPDTFAAPKQYSLIIPSFLH